MQHFLIGTPCISLVYTIPKSLWVYQENSTDKWDIVCYIITNVCYIITKSAVGYCAGKPTEKSRVF